MAPSASYLDLTCQLFLQAKYLHFLNVFLDKDSDDEAIALASYYGTPLACKGHGGRDLSQDPRRMDIQLHNYQKCGK